MLYSRDSALLNIELCQAAYDLCEGNAIHMPPGFSDPKPIKLLSRVPELLKFDDMPLWGLTTRKDGLQRVVFRGTKTFPEWVADFLATPIVNFAHFGFRLIYEALRDGFTMDHDTYITGHSLGAAIATNAFQRGGGQLMTFAGPKSGTGMFCKPLEGTIRVVNEPDEVPKLPGWPFEHGGTEQLIHGPGSSLDWALAHHLTSYYAGVSAGN